jgi:hypothetical protein
MFQSSQRLDEMCEIAVLYSVTSIASILHKRLVYRQDWRGRRAHRAEAVKPSQRLTWPMPQPRHKTLKRA